MSPRGFKGLDSDDPDVDVAAGVLGNRSRSLIVRYLWANGPSKGPDIVKGTGLLSATFSLAATQLEEWNVVSGDLPREMRHGRAVTYTLNEDRVHEIVGAWMAYMSGKTD